MSIGNLLFFIFVILSFIMIFLEALIFIFAILNKVKIEKNIIKCLPTFAIIIACFLLSSLIMLYFELGGIK